MNRITRSHGLELSERSEAALRSFHAARRDRFHRGLFPVLLVVAVLGLWMLAKQLGWI